MMVALKKRFSLYCLMIVFFNMSFFDVLAGKSWAFLNPANQDKVDIVFPSSPISVELQQAMQNMLGRLFVQYGLKFDFNRSDLDPQRSLYGKLANTHTKRKEAFKRSIESSSKAIWMGRGGFGATEVAYLLDQENYQFPDQPKVLIGFSDATKLLLYALKKGWTVLHAPMVAFCYDLKDISHSQVNKQVDFDPLMNAITGKITELTYELEILNHPISLKNTSVIGGNFSLFTESLGTDIEPDLNNRILFIEDEMADGLRVERKILNLLQNKALDGCAAIFIGNQPLSDGKDLKRLIKDMIESFGITMPILHSSDFGHGLNNNVLPMGTKAKLVAINDKKAILTVSVNEPYQEDE